jgi:hypothetical protein
MNRALTYHWVGNRAKCFLLTGARKMKRGRPTKFPEGSVMVGARIQPAHREMLEREARETGSTLSSVIEARLQRTFAEDQTRVQPGD